MFETLEELTYDYEEDGQLVRKMLNREVLSKGAWATVMFQYAERERESGEFRDAKVAIVRFKKSGGVYRKQSSFNISSRKQAKQIVEVLGRWYASVDADGVNDGDGEEADES